jgi:MFS family permease
MIGTGALFLVFVLAPLPSRFADDVGAIEAGRLTLMTVAGIALFSATVCRIGLARGPDSIESAVSLSWLQSLLESLRAARANPRVALSYACAFVARGDLIVVGVFFTLWLTQEGISQGLSSADAIKRAGLFFGVIQGTALLWAPVAGFLNDRLNRVTATTLGLALAAVGYGAMGLISDPLGPLMYFCAMLLGIGQLSVMLASQTLIGQEAPVEHRGAVMGMFSICGALGIMFVTKLGGVIFDSWKPGPFVLVAVCNVVLCLLAARLRRAERANN